MKRSFLLLPIIIATLLQFLLPSATFAQMLDNVKLDVCNIPPGCQEEPICTLTDQCFRYDFYQPKDLGNGDVALKFKITNFSESTFKRATFELPGNGAATKPAVAPLGVFRNRYNHNVINPFNDSLIAFDARNAGTFSYGGFEVYYYVVKKADFLSPAGRFAQVTAQAGRPWQQQFSSTVTFDFDACENRCPRTETACRITDCHFDVVYGGNQGGGSLNQFTPLFQFTNAGGEAVQAITFTLPNGLTAAELTQLNPDNDFLWPASNTNTLLTFTANTTDLDSIGSTGGFVYTLPTARILGGDSIVTITVQTTTGSFNYVFNLATKDPSCPITPLPVELMSFKGNASPEGIVLSWQTATEENNDRFEVERSTDGKHFEKIGVVKGAGNSNTLLSYSYLDNHATGNLNYYRLNQVDFDGTNAHSRVIKISKDGGMAGLGIQLIPNPCLDKNCSVQLRGINPDNPLTVELRDLTGRVVFSKQVPADQTTFELPKIDSGKGIYILSAKNGKNTAHQKVIIN
jgi:hypothetical protein